MPAHWTCYIGGFEGRFSSLLALHCVEIHFTSVIIQISSCHPHWNFVAEIILFHFECSTQSISFSGCRLCVCMILSSLVFFRTLLVCCLNRWMCVSSFSFSVSPSTLTISHAFPLYVYSLIRFMHHHNFIMCTLYGIYFYMQNRLLRFCRFSRFSRLLARFVYHHCSDSSCIDRMGDFVWNLISLLKSDYTLYCSIGCVCAFVFSSQYQHPEQWPIPSFVLSNSAIFKFVYSARLAAMPPINLRRTNRSKATAKMHLN